MIKILNILSNVISEQKRYKMPTETKENLVNITKKLWDDRKKKYSEKTEITRFLFKTAAGVDGMVRIIVNPRLKYIGFMDTKPKGSHDPADIYLEVNPKFYETKKNLYLTLYHEMLHAIDPKQTHEFSPKYMTTYSEKHDEMYWGHPIEFFTITNEFLEGLVNEFKRRAERIKIQENKKYLHKALNNILNYFAKEEPLTKLSTDILYRINDEFVTDEKISRVVADLVSDNPQISEFLSGKKDEIPYYLNYIQLIKKFNPKIWPRFLKMLYNTKDEIESFFA